MSLVTDYLDANGVPYEVLHQDPPTVALEEAQGIQRRRGSFLKATVIDTRVRHAVAVIPASRQLDMRLVRKALADPSVHLASEDELQSDSPRSNWVGPVLGWLLDGETLAALRPRARHGRLRGPHADRVRTRPDARPVPGRACVVRSARATPPRQETDSTATEQEGDHG